MTTRGRTIAGPAALAACAALALGLAVGGSRGADGDDAAGPRDAPLPVADTVVRYEPGYVIAEEFAGRVVAARTSELGFDRPGRLAAVAVDAGDRVEAGALLARLDLRPLEAERLRASAEARRLEAELAMAHLTRERREQLRATDHVSREALDRSLYDERALAAALAAARAAVEAVEAELALSEIRAPFAGTIVARHADEGAVVGAGQAVLRLIEDGALEVEVGLPLEVAASLESGAAQAVRVDGRSHAARLRAVVPSVERDTRTVTAIFRLLPSGAPPRDGQLARVALERRHAETGFWLPVDALAESHRGLWSAFALVPDADDDGRSGGGGTLRVERRQVEVLHADAERVFARGTLRDGERVVASGVHRVVPGQRVRVLE